MVMTYFAVLENIVACYANKLGQFPSSVVHCHNVDLRLYFLCT